MYKGTSQHVKEIPGIHSKKSTEDANLPPHIFNAMARAYQRSMAKKDPGPLGPPGLDENLGKIVISWVFMRDIPLWNRNFMVILIVILWWLNGISWDLMGFTLW